MSISSSALVVSLNISVWPATKLDRQATDQLTRDASAHHNAAKVQKDLFAGNSMRRNIDKKAAHMRQCHAKLTLPWADKGDRLLPMPLFLEYKDKLNKEKPEFDSMCEEFYSFYPQLCANAPVNMGKLYRADDYPDLDDVKSRFGFRYVIAPLAESGDFRLDASNAEMAEQIAELKQQYEGSLQSRLADAMRDPWDRLHTMLTGMSDKLEDLPGEEDDEDAPKKRYHDTLVTNAQDLCKLLAKLNITNDPKLEEARRQLEVTMQGADIEVIKESAQVRESMKTKVDSILNKFNW